MWFCSLPEDELLESQINTTDMNGTSQSWMGSWAWGTLRKKKSPALRAKSSLQTYRVWGVVLDYFATAQIADSSEISALWIPERPRDYLTDRRPKFCTFHGGLHCWFSGMELSAIFWISPFLLQFWSYGKVTKHMEVMEPLAWQGQHPWDSLSRWPFCLYGVLCFVFSMLRASSVRQLAGPEGSYAWSWWCLLCRCTERWNGCSWVSPQGRYGIRTA